MKALSSKRKDILEYVTRFTEENGYPPTVREICAAVNLRSPSTVHSHLKILQEGGYLSKADRKTRSITLKNVPSYKSVPILGTVTAGLPILAYEDVLGYLPFEGDDPDSHFALVVKGDSMVGAAILDGDIVLVRRQSSAQNGQIVVALLGEEATVKRLRLKKDGIWLMPENDAYQPIDGRGCTILGLVKSVFRPTV